MNTLIKPIIVVGSGLAAYTLIREYRKIDTAQPITLITKDVGDFYSKPMLSTAFANQKDAEQLISSSAAKMAEQLNLSIYSHARVEKIRPADHLLDLHLNSGKPIELAYRKLVLALGADQIRLDIGGDAADQILSVNNLSDYAYFRQSLINKKRVLILGAGLIGCEFANDLAIGGFQVEVVDLANQVLGRLLPPAISQALQNKLSELGVVWHLKNTVQTVSKDGASLIATLSNGMAIPTDLVLSAVGLRPKIELAQAAGINTNRGIVVNRQLETNLTGIYSLGDCAEVEGHVLPYVMPIMQAARTLASVLAGQSTSLIYPAMPILVKTPSLPLIVSPPPPSSHGTWTIKNIDQGIEGLFYNDRSELLGFALAGSATNQRAMLSKQLPPLLSET
jgi:rubredoxin-NAD+ reductase